MEKRNSNRDANKANSKSNKNAPVSKKDPKTKSTENPLAEAVVEQLDVETNAIPVVDETAAAAIAEAQAELAKAEAIFAGAKLRLADAKKALAALTGKKGKEKVGPGVIATIFTLVSNADAKGITKADLLTKLVEMFPERAAEGMEKTINVQLPKRMSKERGVKIIKNVETGGFYVEK